jgi:hypothetical protein
VDERRDDFLSDLSSWLLSGSNHFSDSPQYQESSYFTEPNWVKKGKPTESVTSFSVSQDTQNFSLTKMIW